MPSRRGKNNSFRVDCGYDRLLPSVEQAALALESHALRQCAMQFILAYFRAYHQRVLLRARKASHFTIPRLLLDPLLLDREAPAVPSESALDILDLLTTSVTRPRHTVSAAVAAAGGTALPSQHATAPCATATMSEASRNVLRTVVCMATENPELRAYCTGRVGP